MEANHAEKIQVVINTLESMQIPATYDNVSRMTGIYQLLAEIRDSLGREAAEDADHAE